MTIDERLQFLVQSTESLHASVQQLFDITAQKHAQFEADLAELKDLSKRLGALVIQHHDRLDRLDGGNPE